MPAVTLVVCVHRQRDLLERLVRESEGCYDELIVLHDIPDEQNVREITLAAGGKFYEREPAFLQEPRDEGSNRIGQRFVHRFFR